jgi:ankyrin repeat protein
MHNSSVNIATKCELSTPLHVACEKGFGRIAELLIQSGADVYAKDIMWRTPLHHAATIGRTDIGDRSITNKANFSF